MPPGARGCTDSKPPVVSGCRSSRTSRWTAVELRSLVVESTATRFWSLTRLTSTITRCGRCGLGVSRRLRTRRARVSPPS